MPQAKRSSAILRDYMEQHRLSNAKAAAKFGVTGSTIHKYLKDKVMPEAFYLLLKSTLENEERRKANGLPPKPEPEEVVGVTQALVLSGDPDDIAAISLLASRLGMSAMPLHPSK